MGAEIGSQLAGMFPERVNKLICIDGYCGTNSSEEVLGHLQSGIAASFKTHATLKVFPTLDWVEVPFSHPVYHQTFDFDQGLPKIHEHDDLPPRGLGLFFEGRLLCFYDTECDLGDGWEDYQVHRDPESVRLLALQMGANLIQFAMGGAE